MPSPLIALEGVTLLAPDGHPVFEDLDWEVAAGSRHYLSGGQGNGATALLRLWAGLARPVKGRILLDGLPLDLDALNHPYINAGKLGWVPTDGGLAVNLTLLANVALPLRFALHVGREEAEDQANLWLERAGLARLAGSRPRIPPDRTCWLTALARAGAKGSRLWIVDRPPGALDGPSLRAARGILELAAQDAATTLVLVGGEWMSALGTEFRIDEGRLSSGSSA